MGPESFVGGVPFRILPNSERNEIHNIASASISFSIQFLLSGKMSDEVRERLNIRLFFFPLDWYRHTIQTHDMEILTVASLSTSLSLYSFANKLALRAEVVVQVTSPMHGGLLCLYSTYPCD